MVEFVVLGFMLMVPTMYFLLAVFTIQSGSMAANAAAEQAAQSIENQGLESLSSSSVTQSAQLAAQDYSVSAQDLSVSVNCATDCSEQQAVQVAVTVQVHVPLIPWISGATLGQVHSHATVWGGRYR